MLTSPEDIAKMRRVCRMSREVLNEAIASVRPGITTDDIDQIVHEACIRRGAYPSPLNYRGFPKSVCTSVNEVICHGIPDGRPLQNGDILNIDVSVYYDGFHGDLNETVLVGDGVDQRGRELVECTRRCLDLAIAACGNGVKYRDIGAVIEAEAKKSGFSVNRTYCGHGINRLFHCPPTVPHYAGNKAIGIMRPGHVFTIEPMVCEGASRDVHWPDNWTAVTADGKRSAQFEQTLFINDEGLVEILTL
jgi:methionyl aminopeptidase